MAIKIIIKKKPVVKVKIKPKKKPKKRRRKKVIGSTRYV